MVKSENAPYLKFGDESLGGSSPSGSTKITGHFGRVSGLNRKAVCTEGSIPLMIHQNFSKQVKYNELVSKDL